MRAKPLGLSPQPTPSAEIYLFTFVVTPKPGNKIANRTSGASFVNVWIRFPYRNLSEVIARHCVRDIGWRIRKLDGTSKMTREAARQKRCQKFYDEALRDGVSIVFYHVRREK